MSQRLAGREFHNLGAAILKDRSPKLLSIRPLGQLKTILEFEQRVWFLTLSSSLI